MLVSGTVMFRTADGEEVFEATHAHDVEPGHTPTSHAGTEVVEFSPTEESGRTIEGVTANSRG